MIALANVTHRYPARWRPGTGTVALDDLTCSIDAGSIVGLIGVNGAGKTTLLRILLGYLNPTAGEVRIGGLRPRQFVERFGIAYVPERVAIPHRWTVEGAMQGYAMLGNLEAPVDERIDTTLRRLGLNEIRRRRVGALSKGNMQRLAIAQAILCERQVMILDEPSDSLDPLWTSELREIVQSWRNAGDTPGTVILASHDLSLVERIADRVIVLHEGRILADMVDYGREERRRGSLEESFLRLVHARDSAA